MTQDRSTPAYRRDDFYLVRNEAFVEPGMTNDPSFLRFDSADGRSILDRFDDIVARFADRIAVEDANNRFSFAELQRCVDGFARQIDEAAPADRPVACLVHNSAAYPAVLLATLAAGRIFVPIDASHPVERQQAILRETVPGLIVTTADRPADLDALAVQAATLRLDPLAPGEGPRPQRPVGRDDPIALIFTSGSTGRPKGSAVSEYAYISLVAEQINQAGLGPDDVVLGLVTLSAGGARECLAALLSAARLRLVDMKAEGLQRALAAAADATFLTFAPSIMRTILGVAGAAEALGRLRILNLGGEALTRADLDLFAAKLPGCRVVATMGSTEATSVFRWAVRGDAIDEAGAPAGYIVEDMAVMIVDDEGQPVEGDAPGELVVKGRRLSLGIWRDGQLLSGPMMADPADPLQRIYRTGDIMRIRADGLAQFVGRRDRMIKMRGLKINLQAVEDALTIFPAVLQAVAMPVGLNGPSPRLIAFVATNGEAIDTKALRRHVAEETAEYMAPSRIVVLDTMPQLANYKPDLLALERMAAGAAPD